MADTREKLIELLGGDMCKGCYCEDCEHENNENACIEHIKSKMADHLIANGVTVQDGKTIEAFLHPIDAYKGIKAKYLVFKADTGAKVDNCFILRPDKDTVAIEALRAYASATNNETLAEDIYNWVGKGEPVQKWIPVTEELPKLIPCGAGTAYSEAVNVLTSGRKVLTAIWDGTDFIADAEFWEAEGEEITHWTPVLLPLPEPPKGE